MVRKGVVRSHEHPPGSATTKSSNLRGGAQHLITLIGPYLLTALQRVFLTSYDPLRTLHLNPRNLTRRYWASRGIEGPSGGGRIPTISTAEHSSAEQRNAGMREQSQAKPGDDDVDDDDDDALRRGDNPTYPR